MVNRNADTMLAANFRPSRHAVRYAIGERRDAHRHDEAEQWRQEPQEESAIQDFQPVPAASANTMKPVRSAGVRGRGSSSPSAVAMHGFRRMAAPRAVSSSAAPSMQDQPRRVGGWFKPSNEAFLPDTIHCEPRAPTQATIIKVAER